MKNFIHNFCRFRLLVLVFSFISLGSMPAWAQIAISSFSPSSGPVGQEVTIHGSNFTGTTSVKFNGVEATSFTVETPGRIKAIVANNTKSGKITVTNGTFVNSASDFTVFVTWIGGFNNNSWDDNRNWSDNEVPDLTTNVVIQTGSPVINDAAQCKNLTLFNASLTLDQPSSHLNVYGDFISTGGTYNHTAGMITFAGSTQQIPALDYHNVTIGGTGSKSLLGNASVNNLYFSGTNSSLVSSNPATTTLILYGSISGETQSRSYIGKLEKSSVVDQFTSSDVFGNIGVNFQNSENGNWGNVTVTRVTGAAISNPANPTYHSINRYWDIVPQRPNTNTLVSLTLTWLTTENNDLTFPSSKAQAWRSEDNGGSWVPVDGPKTITENPGPGERSITVATKTFSKWGISDQNNPLPVSWLSFNGKATDKGNELTWATASEKNSENFIVERSSNGKNFEAIGTVRAAGNSAQVLTYNFTDVKAAAGKTYYRLKQTDFDGAYEYSTLIVVNRTEKGRSFNAEVYPNPFAENLNLRLQAADGVKEVKLLALDGKEVYRKTIASETEVQLNNIPALKPGMYLLQLHGANGVTTLKVTRQ